VEAPLEIAAALLKGLFIGVIFDVVAIDRRQPSFIIEPMIDSMTSTAIAALPTATSSPTATPNGKKPSRGKSKPRAATAAGT
jgi:hypothetical protein